MHLNRISLFGKIILPSKRKFKHFPRMSHGYWIYSTKVERCSIIVFYWYMQHLYTQTVSTFAADFFIFYICRRNMKNSENEFFCLVTHIISGMSSILSDFLMVMSNESDKSLEHSNT